METAKFTKEDVESYADKLLIGLTEEENKMVLDEFNDIDADIARITEIEGIENVEPMTHCLDDFEYELREDVYDEEIGNVDIDDLLANCDDYVDTEIRVPKVVG
jgi:aspartyl/glutamyl-tRNA(Asn/Gln) amidotransferase C subunit